MKVKVLVAQLCPTHCNSMACSPTVSSTGMGCHSLLQEIFPTERLKLGFLHSSSHVWMWELDHKESWVLENWCFWTVVLEKTLESPLDCKEIKPVHPKGNKSWIFIGRTDEAETPILWPPDVKNWLIGKDPDAGKDWRQEEKGTREDEKVGWHHQLDGHEFEWSLGAGDGQGGLACCSPWDPKESNTTKQLNWTSCIEGRFFTLWATREGPKSGLRPGNSISNISRSLLPLAPHFEIPLKQQRKSLEKDTSLRSWEPKFNDCCIPLWSYDCLSLFLFLAYWSCYGHLSHIAGKPRCSALVTPLAWHALPSYPHAYSLEALDLFSLKCFLENGLKYHAPSPQHTHTYTHYLPNPASFFSIAHIATLYTVYFTLIWINVCVSPMKIWAPWRHGF